MIMKLPEITEKQKQENLKMIRRKIKENPKNKTLAEAAAPKLILEDPDLFNRINKELDKKIVGEEATRKVILLVANGRNVDNPSERASYNLMVNAESGAGKDYVTSNTLKILPKSEVVKRRRRTKKGFAYWHNSKFEPEWTWDKKLFYCEDIPNSVLNEDVFKVMASSGNATSTIVINQKAVDIQIEGKPVMIITIAEADPKSENLRRFPIVDLDESINQTKEIMKRQSEYAMKGYSTDYNNSVMEAHNYLKRVKVKIPFADLIAKHFPIDHIIMRTNYNRFLDYIKSSCSYHQKQRTQDKEGFYLSTEQDYTIARECLTKTISSKNLVPITKNQKKILEKIRRFSNKDKFSINDLVPKITFMSDRALRSNIDKLTDLGYFTRENESVLGINKPVIMYTFVDSPTFKIPDYNYITSNTSIETNNTIASIASNTKVKEVKEVNETQIQDELSNYLCDKCGNLHLPEINCERDGTSTLATPPMADF